MYAQIPELATLEETVVAVFVGSIPLLVLLVRVLIDTRQAKQKAADAHEQAKQANDAVNHRHARIMEGGNTPPKAYDAILDVRSDVKQLANRLGDIYSTVQFLMLRRMEEDRERVLLPTEVKDANSVAVFVSELKNAITETKRLVKWVEENERKLSDRAKSYDVQEGTPQDRRDLPPGSGRDSPPLDGTFDQPKRLGNG